MIDMYFQAFCAVIILSSHTSVFLSQTEQLCISKGKASKTEEKVSTHLVVLELRRIVSTTFTNSRTGMTEIENRAVQSSNMEEANKGYE